MRGSELPTLAFQVGDRVPGFLAGPAAEHLRQHAADEAEPRSVHDVRREKNPALSLHGYAHHRLHFFPPGGEQELDQAVKVVDSRNPDRGNALLPRKPADLLGGTAAPQKRIAGPEAQVA